MQFCFYESLLEQDANLMYFSKTKRFKKALFKTVLGNLE